ncbi:Uncharacterised protein [Mycobacteroides abscessus subsp. massiliense]|uniref:hypothetical protein n=1 Tax=Mycobacteroides abscessus TaxID=36809 RepID=UPI0005DE928F|nr:hypothetical protein [Mycobacteroides abscessus]SKI16611.1 Uncharacterised protein [Mycobacteroides abscessus subsp. massiliense]SKS24442.1 Uncharacterised protein [Mycobacteroides abscessus subsp. bolletii]CPT92915.1 Uncharacterised protein [Mycobacteroides abscessus]CPW96639.1 Uncharacterised protein [Mycobacteroides abscessus]CQA08129.1 Uncharacterised protein [Mycobacteroides abscessus]
MAEVSDAQKLTAKVVRMHERNPWGQHDGWWECFCGAVYSHEHVAAEIEKAFGRLTQEHRTLHNGWVQPGYGAFYYAQGLTPPPAIITNQVRWVSTWAEVSE